MSMDYCYFGTRDGKTQSILVVRDRDTRFMWTSDMKITFSFLVHETNKEQPIRMSSIEFQHSSLNKDTLIARSSSSATRSRQLSFMLPKLQRYEMSRQYLGIFPFDRLQHHVIKKDVKEVEYQGRAVESAVDQKLRTDSGTSAKC